MTEQQEKVCREEFEKWAGGLGLIAVSHGIRSEWSQLDLLWRAWQAALTTVAPVQQSEAELVDIATEIRISNERGEKIEQLFAELSAANTTNAAQAEQLAAMQELNLRTSTALAITGISPKDRRIGELMSALREADNLLSQYSINPQDQEAIENIHALLQSSIPPEPQAGVELTDEDESVETALRYARFIASEINSEESRHPVQDIDGEYWPARLHSLCERALNQRQAVKPLSDKQDYEQNCIRSCNPPKESAAQGVPEGLVLVPKEPTAEMKEAWLKECCNQYDWMYWDKGYKAMLSAAPEQAESKEGKGE